MDIICKKQETADVIITVPLAINTGAPDTGATLTIKAINPDGSENTTFTAPTVTEIISGGGVYKLTFGTAAANRLFTQEDTPNPYTLLITSATSGSTAYRAIRVYCSTKMPGEYATATAVAALPTLSGIEGSTVLAKAANLANLPTLAQIEASSVLAKESTVSARPILSTIEGSSVLAKEATVTARPTLAQVEASTVLAKEATVTARPTLAQVEASTVLAKEATVSAVSTMVTFIKKMFTNHKTLSAAGSVYILNVFDNDDATPILTKVIKDVAGADISAPATGVIARELKSSV